MKRFTRTWGLNIVVGTIGLVILGCETVPWPVDYLTDTVGHVTQEDVRGKLGEPSLIAPALDGSVLWTYRYVRDSPNSGVYECYEYALKFDRQGVFRSWVQEECLDKDKPRGS